MIANFNLLMPSIIFLSEDAHDILTHWSSPNTFPGTITKPKSSIMFLQKSTDEILLLGSLGKA